MREEEARGERRRRRAKGINIRREGEVRLGDKQERQIRGEKKRGERRKGRTKG